MGAFTPEDADKYFQKGVHPAAEIWNGATKQQRTAALTYAKRQLERCNGGTLTDPSSSSNAVVRADEAYYEQGLHVLTHSPYRANGEQGGIDWDLVDTAGDPSTLAAPMDTLCTAAIRLMGWWPYRIVRG